MKIDNSFKAVFASMMIVSGLAACDKPGTAETAGKKIDQVTESVSTSVSNTADKANTVVTQQGEVASQKIDDSEITAQVKSLLLNEPGLRSMKISVATSKGIVTLSGSADSVANRDKAIKLSEGIDGVGAVKSQLLIAK